MGSTVTQGSTSGNTYITFGTMSDRIARNADAFRRGYAQAREDIAKEPVPMRITCERCGELHIDEGEFATRPHHTHACQKCGLVWRPAIVPTVGVRFLPGFLNEKESR